MHTSCHISDSVTKKKILKSHRRRIKSTAHGKQEPTIHRNSKWSCNSTCFDSSGRICAVCEQKLRQTTAALSPFIPVTIHKSTNTCLMWISLTNTDCCCFSWFFLNFFFFLYSHSKDVIILTAATPVGSYYPTPSFFESSFADNWCLIPWK